MSRFELELAREWFKSDMNELLPLLFVPTTSTLGRGQSQVLLQSSASYTYLNGVGSFRLRILLGLFT